MKPTIVLICSVLAAGIVHSLLYSASAEPTEDQVAVRQALLHTFEKPGEALSLDPVVVEDDAAIVGWVQGDMAGRAFLRRTKGKWMIVACGGDALKNADKLQALGLDRARAEFLVSLLATAEKAIDPKRAALFSTFDEVIEMGREGDSTVRHRRH